MRKFVNLLLLWKIATFAKLIIKMGFEIFSNQSTPLFIFEILSKKSAQKARLRVEKPPKESLCDATRKAFPQFLRQPQ